MAATMVDHDHAAQVETFGLCLTCEDRSPRHAPDPAEQLVLDDPSFVAAGADAGNHTAQMVRLITVVGDGRWRSLEAIADETGDPLDTVRARLRDLGGIDFGGWSVDHRTTTAGMRQVRATRA